MWVRSLGQKDALEKEMATHSSILAWKIPWTEEPGGLQSMGSRRVRQTEVTEHALVHTKWGRHSLLITLTVAACISSNPTNFYKRDNTNGFCISLM